MFKNNARSVDTVVAAVQGRSSLGDLGRESNNPAGVRDKNVETPLPKRKRSEISPKELSNG